MVEEFLEVLNTTKYPWNENLIKKIRRVRDYLMRRRKYFTDLSRKGYLPVREQGQTYCRLLHTFVQE